MTPQTTGEGATLHLGYVMLATRYLTVPIHLGGPFGRADPAMVTLGHKIFAFARKLRASSTDDTILAVLGFMDLSLLANIVLIVAPAGRQNLVDPGLNARSEAPPAWIALGFGAIRPKLIGSSTAIAAIAMLERSEPIGSLAVAAVMWQLAIVIGLGMPGVLLAARNRPARGLSKECTHAGWYPVFPGRRPL